MRLVLEFPRSNDRPHQNFATWLDITMNVPFHYTVRERIVRRVSQHLSSPSQHAALDRIDWDVLLILDACRLDSLRHVASWPVRATESPATTTPE